MKLSSLSFVFPAYNEEPNIRPLVAAVLKLAPTVAKDFEIIIVNDGSKDKTKAIVEALAKKDKHVRLVDNPQNMGYGQTVWNGLRAASKEWVFFSDADLQFDLSELKNLTPHSTDFDVVVGYRARRRDPFIRLVNAKSWNLFIRLLLGVKIKDLDCAFKLFRRRVLDDLEITAGGATFSAELMARLQKKGLVFKEVPVTHLPRQAGNQTGAKFKVIVRAFKEVFRLYRKTDLGNPNLRDLWRFAVVGLVSTIIDITALNLSYRSFHTSLYLAAFIGFLLGSINGYLLNNAWTYRRLDKRAGLLGLTKYTLISLVGLGLTEVIIDLLSVRSNLNYNVSKLVAVAVVFFWNFFGNRWWTFQDTAQTKPTAQKKQWWPWLTALALIIGWSVWEVWGHLSTAIISFDEGFHGGIALYFSQLIPHLLAHGSGHHFLDYIRSEFANGIIYYPPLWNALAGVLGWIFGPSTAIFRLATTIFGAGTLLMLYQFVRRFWGNAAALLSIIVLGSMPIFFIYGHLMMLEVPLAFTVSLALIAFYWFLTVERVTPLVFLLTTLAFALGVQGKIIGIAVIVGALGLYGLVLLLAFRRSTELRRFYSLATLFYLLVAGASWYAYIWVVKQYLHADMLGFFFDQSQSQTANHASPLIGFLQTVWLRKEFYLRDFYHYPLLSLIWFGSLGYLAIFERSKFTYYLLAWALASWIVFSGVLPQVPQYVIPVLVPLAIATGIAITVLVRRLFESHIQPLALSLVAVGLFLGQASSIMASETAGWRYHQTSQEQAAAYIADHAQIQDRVVVWGDGTRYAVQLEGLAKQLQTYNGLAAVCKDAVSHSADWAIVESGPVEAEARAMMDLTIWQEATEFNSPNARTVVYRNPTAANGAKIEAEEVISERGTVIDDARAGNGRAAALIQSKDNPNIFGCYRELTPGVHRIIFRAAPGESQKPAHDDESIAQLEVWPVGALEPLHYTLAGRDLRDMNYHDYPITVTASGLNNFYEIRVRVYRRTTILVDSVTIE